MIKSKHILFLLSALILFGCDNSVTVEPTNESHFVKYYGQGGSQYACDMVVDTDGFVILANTDVDEDNRQVYLLKTDEFGNELWSQTFGDLLREDAVSIDKLPAGGYAIAANLETGIGMSDIKVWITDMNGLPIDSAIFGLPQYSEIVSEIRVLSDGGYLISGETNEPPVPQEGNRLKSVYLVRTLPGTLTELTENEWSTIHGVGDINFGAGVVEFNNQYFAFGTTDSNNPEANGIQGLKIILFPLDNTGVGNTVNYYGEDNDQIAQTILKTDGGFVLLGNTLNAGNSDIYIQKVSNGLAKQATLKISQRNIKGLDVFDTGLGYLIIGTETLSVDDSNIYLSLIDKNPQIGTENAIQIWERTFGGLNLDSGASGLTVLADGSIVFVGTIELGNQSKVALIKTNKNGDLTP